jgi:Protein of unknown function (DUF1566)
MRVVAITAFALLSAAASAEAQIWAVQLNQNRFTVLPQFNNEAVLDRETGLVWERSPGTETFPWSGAFVTAHVICNIRIVGDRLGWRLPTIQELASLVDPNRFSPNLPAGHPFILTPEQISSGTFWSATTADIDQPNRAWFLRFLSGSNQVILHGSGDKTTPRYVWCVRGFKGTDIQ